MFLCRKMAFEFVVRLNPNTYPDSQVFAYIVLHDTIYHKCSFNECQSHYIEMLAGTTVCVRGKVLQWQE
jgi:hypothetical protein